MDKKLETRPGLNNANTRFAKFKWSEHPKLAKALKEARERLGGGDFPVRFKVKL